jgi:AI-2 transport protein TqsA
MTEEPTGRLRPATEKIALVCLLLITAVVLGAGLAAVRSVAIPFVLSVFFAYLLTPLVKVSEARLRLPRALAVGLTMVVTLVLLGAVFVLLFRNIAELAQSMDAYRDRVLLLIGRVTPLLEPLGIHLDARTIAENLRSLPVFALATWAAQRVGTFLFTGLLVLVFVLFLLLGTSPVPTRGGIYREIDRKVRRYLVTRLLTSTVTGALVGGLLAVLHIDLAFSFGVATFLLNFVPTIGSIVATLLPLPVALLHYESFWPPVLVIGLIGALQFLIGNVIEPRILGTELDLHPAAIVLSLLFWGLIWGPVGMLLAVPLLAAMRIAFERIESMRGIAELLAGRLPESAEQ